MRGALLKMNVERDYDKWADSYDSTPNKTRDLDLVATKLVVGLATFDSILEIGCGTGKNTEWLSRKCSRLVAVDFSDEMMRIAKNRVPLKHVEWNRFDISRPWPLENTGFDLVTFNLVLEHVRDLNPVIAEAASRLAKGGMILVSELHPFKQYLGSKARFETGNGTRELEVFTHHVSDFTSALSEAGLRIMELKEWFDGDRSGIPRLLTILAVNS